MKGKMTEFVNATIRKARVVIFTKTCPYCTMAKEVSDC